ncbi:MAG: hypothetical protein J6T32_01950 [Paludibacteraceae bacterium]|nr:hypothetical protein [Paludibacteraceae bacterium]
MKKKQYTTPFSEVMLIGSEVILKGLGPASLPEQAGAPARRAGEIPCDTI